MNKYAIPMAALLLAIQLSSSAFASEVGELTTFTAGTPAKADEVNGNFNQVADAVDDNSTRLAAAEEAINENGAQVEAVVELIEELPRAHIFEFEDLTFTNSLSLEIPISREIVDSSLILVYFNPSDQAESAWYPIPGIGSGNNYETRFFIFQTSVDPSVYRLTVVTRNPDTAGSYDSEVTFTKLRLYIAPAFPIAP